MDDFGDLELGGLDTSGGFDFSDIGGSVSNLDWASLLNSASNVIGSSQTAPSTTVWGQSGATSVQGMGSIPSVVRGLSGPLLAAISKLGARLGGSGSPLAWARKAYGMLASWSAKNPSASVIALLVNLGLTVEEAAHFIGWGATQKRRRRRRGVSGRDLKTTRRTIRTITTMSRSLQHLCAAVPHRRARRA